MEFGSLLLSFFFFLFLGCLQSFSHSTQERFIGRDDSNLINPSRVIQLSWRPRAFLYKGFLSYEECDHFIALAMGKLEQSTVADEKTGESVRDEVRTSSGMFVMKDQERFIGRDDSNLINPSRVIQLSWRPRAFLYKGFLSYEECDHLIALAIGKLEQSTVVDEKTGESV